MRAGNGLTPAMALDFLRSETPDSRLSISGGTGGTRVNSSGNIVAASAPRFDYSPTSIGTSLGLLVEEQRTQLLLNSKIDGTNLATQSVTVTAQAYTLTFYGTGTVTLSGTSTAGPLVGSGAYPTRSTLTFTPTAGTLTLTVTGTVQFAQLEAGSFATSFIPSAGAQVTRTADSVSMTGSNFSAWFNATAGTFVTEHLFEGAGSGGTTRILEVHDGTSSNRIVVGDTSTAARGLVSVSGASQYDQPITYGAQSPRKSALAFAAADFQIVAAGTLGTAGASGTLPTVNQMTLGGSATGVFGGIWLRRINFFPRRVANAQDQVLTQ